MSTRSKLNNPVQNISSHGISRKDVPNLARWCLHHHVQYEFLKMSSEGLHFTFPLAVQIAVRTACYVMNPANMQFPKLSVVWVSSLRTSYKSQRSTCGICTRRADKLYKARSRLYRSQILQVNTRWKALAEIYTMHSYAPFFNLKIPAKNRQHFFAIE